MSNLKCHLWQVKKVCYNLIREAAGFKKDTANK